MPIPLLPIAGLIAGAATAGANRRSQKKQNQADRLHDIGMYQRQRRDAIKDWERQNAYNHPAQQMQRLKEAGLNPNLVYGKGADNTAAMVRSSQGSTNKLPAPQVNMQDATGPLFAMYDMRQKQATTDNVMQQTQLLKADEQLRQAQTIKTLEEGKTTKFDLELKTQIENDLLNRQRLENEHTLERIETENHRQDLIYRQTQSETERIQLLKFENRLAKKGLTKNDPRYLRFLQMWLSSSKSERRKLEKELGF